MMKEYNAVKVQCINWWNYQYTLKDSMAPYANGYKCVNMHRGSPFPSLKRLYSPGCSHDQRSHRPVKSTCDMFITLRRHSTLRLECPMPVVVHQTFDIKLASTTCNHQLSSLSMTSKDGRSIHRDLLGKDRTGAQFVLWLQNKHQMWRSCPRIDTPQRFIHAQAPSQQWPEATLPCTPYNSLFQWIQFNQNQHCVSHFCVLFAL
jgi:hypothetical protein